MTNATVKYRSSDISTVLNPAKLAATAPEPVLRPDSFSGYEVLPSGRDGYFTVKFVDRFDDQNDTDPHFVFGREEHYERPLFPLRLPSKILGSGVLDFGGLEYNVRPEARFNVFGTIKGNTLSSLQPQLMKAQNFFHALPSEQQTDLVEEIVSLIFFAGDIQPEVERIDDIITIDVSRQGRSLGIMVDQDACAISSFTKTKELKATFFVKEKAGLDDFKDVLRHELLLFAA